MMRLLKSTSAALLFLALSLTAHADDVDKSDPLRKQLLDAARGKSDDRFIVKKLIRSDYLAYMCALKTDKDGNVLKTTDTMTNIYKYLFVHHGNAWIAQPIDEGALTEKYTEDDCEPPLGNYFTFFPDDLEGDHLAIRSMWVYEAREFMLASLEDKNWHPEERQAITILHGYEVLKQLPDNEFEKSSGSIALAKSIAEKKCGKDETCKAALKSVRTRLEVERTSSKVSALVWEACTRRALVDISLDRMEQCVAKFSAKNYCAPGMDFFTDRSDIARCYNEIRQNEAAQ